MQRTLELKMKEPSGSLVQTLGKVKRMLPDEGMGFLGVRFTVIFEIVEVCAVVVIEHCEKFAAVNLT